MATSTKKEHEMTTLTGNQIEAARLLTLRQALKLELRGMKRRGRTAYSILRDMGFRGSREAVLEQLDDIRNQLIGEKE
jgi:succinylarginine dihydrolase